MAKYLRFSVTINEDVFPELYEALVKVGTGRRRGDRLKLLATENLKGTVQQPKIEKTPTEIQKESAALDNALARSMGSIANLND